MDRSKKKNEKIGLISLGCSKNRVDSEVILGLLKNNGYLLTQNPEEADIIIINTCSFIEPAKREAVESILEMAQMKKKGRCRFLIVTGCLAQECGIKLFHEMPEVDALIGPGEMARIVEVIDQLNSAASKNAIHFLSRTPFLYDHSWPRIRTTRPHIAYIKISDGCDHCCSYCLIPKLRGSYRERELESVVVEAKKLAREGVKEICLIAQDTTAFTRLSLLLERLASIEEGPWIRLLYTYPFSVDHALIDIMPKYPNVLSYLDIPLQHSNPRILKAMKRPSDIERIEKLIHYARSSIPDLVIRTTFMVGFPGETDDEFKHLMAFVQKMRFDHLGVFEYSRERGTEAYHMPGQVSKRIKQKRYHKIMALQADISNEKNRSQLGRIVEVICDCPDPDQQGIIIGRTKGQAPEIDGVTYIAGEDLKTGEICRIRITGSSVYDLEGIKVI
ncbi:MAG: 30S ribosomal protein S12 methylthiotransferase RimO [bacterium]